jgi:hypothetical protein
MTKLQNAIPVPVSLNLQAGVVKQSPAVDVPDGAAQATLVIDATWLTDPTATISWAIERSNDGGQTWLPVASSSRPGGNQPDKFGELHPNIDINVKLNNIQGQKIRGDIGYVTGDTGLPASANATGTLTLT